MFIQNCCIPDVIVEPNLMSALAQIEAESMGWIPLEDGAYLHVGSGDGVVDIVGLADAGMAGANVLWLV